MSSHAGSQDLFWDTESQDVRDDEDADHDASSTVSLADMQTPPPGQEGDDALTTTDTTGTTDSDHEGAPAPDLPTAPGGPHLPPPGLSPFEAIVTTYPPVLESLLAQLPTHAVLALHGTSRPLRQFLRAYPLAWKTLSFRLPTPAAQATNGALPTPAGSDSPDQRGDRQSRAYAFDALLRQVIAPYASRLTSLDLCNTAVSGIALVGSVLAPRTDSLQHLSVRGCKNVSIKYHIVPFLEPYTVRDSPWAPRDLALRSLYTYRCRHHRRRPYLPSSLARRDSDSDPTHQLIDICHKLDIWTDTAWCPTPAARCFRRKDYHAGRQGPLSMEVWVPFDRLWRSGNRLGPVQGETKIGTSDGRLWELHETGENGEPLGTENGACRGEGKHVPAHLRKSHTTFTDDVTCSQCHDVILERCESCSVRMHCMGCRKTLCASCAFNRPIPRKRVKTRHFANLAFGTGAGIGSTFSQGAGADQSWASNPPYTNPPHTNRFWWAPGATRSPNLMSESTHEDDSDDSDDGGNMHNLNAQPPNREPPKLNMYWCCLEPIFSGGGGIAVLGTGLGGRGCEKIRAAPLPQSKEWEDPDFSNQLRPVDYVRELKNNGLYEYVLGEDVDILSYLKQESIDLQANSCPRGLCNDCYRSFRWKVSCRACKSPICKEHDFRALKFRKCGYRDMHTERDHARSHQETASLVIPKFNASRSSKIDVETTPPPPPWKASDPASEHGEDDSNPMSHSQVFFPPTPSPTPFTHSSPFTNDSSPASSSSMPFIPVSSSRPRSFSASGVRSRNSGTWSNTPRGQATSITNPLPLPCHPRHPVQWEGCGSYFCQYPRPVGDHRMQCPAHLRECSSCAVLVCDSCTSLNPSCTCTFCTVHFHCPHCARKPEIASQCRLEQETREQEEAAAFAKMQQENEMRARGQADDVADAAYEFWSLLDDHVLEELGDVHVQEEGQDLAPPNTPDSITVTTVFGVSEESSSVTTITANGEGVEGVHPAGVYALVYYGPGPMDGLAETPGAEEDGEAYAEAGALDEEDVEVEFGPGEDEDGDGEEEEESEELVDLGVEDGFGDE